MGSAVGRGAGPPCQLGFVPCAQAAGSQLVCNGIVAQETRMHSSECCGEMGAGVQRIPRIHLAIAEVLLVFGVCWLGRARASRRVRTASGMLAVVSGQ